MWAIVQLLPQRLQKPKSVCIFMSMEEFILLKWLWFPCFVLVPCPLFHQWPPTPGAQHLGAFCMLLLVTWLSSCIETEIHARPHCFKSHSPSFCTKKHANVFSSFSDSMLSPWHCKKCFDLEAEHTWYEGYSRNSRLDAVWFMQSMFWCLWLQWVSCLC